MIIDFHTHIFPDRIAARTISYLADKGNILPYTDGTAGGLVSKIRSAGVDIAVTQPVLTSPTQFDSVLRFADGINHAEYSDARLISFAGIHPLCEDIDGKMKLIKEMGFLGVKIHPDYQGEFFDHEGYIRILECSNEYGLVVLAHAGVDRGFPGEPVRCAPALARKVIERVRPKRLVLAHLGGCEMYDEVERELCGLDVYFDTAYVLRDASEEEFKRILIRHGEDRIIFATDSPWSDVGEDVSTIRSFGLEKSTEEKILCTNARGLLGI